MRNYHLFILIIITLAFSACNNKSSEEGNSNTNTTTSETKGQSAVVDEVSDPNALQLAESLEDFSSLVQAIKKAGVEDAVVNAGPLTIFAPTNEAFAKLPEGTVDELFKPENKAKLAHILTNHVAPANYPIEQLSKEAEKGRKLYMASGNYLDVVEKDGKITVGGFEIVKSVKVSNGWIHVINDVIVPSN
ncbi:MAG: fasciclin domain-containing protein [Chitinophagales bacterium]|nr:fasciclin domain-containing protein [Chitinophagales bacterium]